MTTTMMLVSWTIGLVALHGTPAACTYQLQQPIGESPAPSRIRAQAGNANPLLGCLDEPTPREPFSLQRRDPGIPHTLLVTSGQAVRTAVYPCQAPTFLVFREVGTVPGKGLVSFVWWR